MFLHGRRRVPSLYLFFSLVIDNSAAYGSLLVGDGIRPARLDAKSRRFCDVRKSFTHVPVLKALGAKPARPNLFVLGIRSPRSPKR
jgi:hypothetical protein